MPLAGFTSSPDPLLAVCSVENGSIIVARSILQSHSRRSHDSRLSHPGLGLLRGMFHASVRQQNSSRKPNFNHVRCAGGRIKWTTGADQVVGGTCRLKARSPKGRHPRNLREIRTHGSLTNPLIAGNIPHFPSRDAGRGMHNIVGRLVLRRRK